MPYRLVVDLDGRKQRCALRPGENLVGSDPTCDVRLAHPTVSRHHAVVVVTASGVQVADLGSSNGTVTGGHAVRNQPVELRSDDAVAFGAVTGRLEQVAADDAVSARSGSAKAGPPPPSSPTVGTSDPRTTASTHPAQLFTLGHLPRLTAALADGVAGTAFIQLLGTAVSGSLPCRSLEIRRGPRAAPLFAIGSGVDGTLVRVGDDDLEVVAAFESADQGRLYRPMLEVTWHLGRLAGATSGQGRAVPVPDRAHEASFEGVPSVVAEVGRLMDDAAKIARGDVNVLVLGESGTGKELMARFIHRSSARASGPFLEVNCAALPQELLESELFGVEKGVATGVDARPGKFESAHGGTLFLDEIGDMALDVQAKILRVIEDRSVYRLGGAKPKPADVRVVAATNRNLERLLETEKFRADLYHRIAGWEARLLPLRDRPGDIPNLAARFVEQESERLGVATSGLSKAALRALIHYHWPGNIRELRREIARAMLFVSDGELVDTRCLSPRVAAEAEQPPGGLRAHMERAEWAEIQRVLAEHDGHVASAAETLDVPVSTLYRKLKRESENDLGPDAV
jgi:DNA-binding NtrC family response regulator